MDNIEVAVRIRNISGREIGKNESTLYSNANHWKVIQDKHAVVQTTNRGSPLPAKAGRTFFKYTRAFDGGVSNSKVYDSVCQNAVQSFLQGINSSIIAFGQTGSGKTFTMHGGQTAITNEIQDGIIQMAGLDIFDHLRNLPQNEYTVRLSMFEIYNHEIHDLLTNTIVSSRQDPRSKLLLDVSEQIVTDFSSFIDLIDLGNERRITRKTHLNNNSSRSHVICSLSLEFMGSARSSLSPFESNLYMVDLAGSDSSLRNKKKVDGQQQNEANYINKSLLSLSNVIMGLSRKTFVNFRNSILTRILQPFLDGSAKVVVICCAGPTGVFAEGTRKTLEFGLYAKQIKCKTKIKYISISTPKSRASSTEEKIVDRYDEKKEVPKKKNAVPANSYKLHEPTAGTTVDDKMSLIEEQWKSMKSNNVKLQPSPPTKNIDTNVANNATEKFDSSDVDDSYYFLSDDDDDDSLLMSSTAFEVPQDEHEFNISKTVPIAENNGVAYFDESATDTKEAANVPDSHSEQQGQSQMPDLDKKMASLMTTYNTTIGKSDERVSLRYKDDASTNMLNQNEGQSCHVFNIEEEEKSLEMNNDDRTLRETKPEESLSVGFSESIVSEEKSSTSHEKSLLVEHDDVINTVLGGSAKVGGESASTGIGGRKEISATERGNAINANARDITLDESSNDAKDTQTEYFSTDTKTNIPSVSTKNEQTEVESNETSGVGLIDQHGSDDRIFVDDSLSLSSESETMSICCEARSKDDDNQTTEQTMEVSIVSNSHKLVSNSNTEDIVPPMDEENVMSLLDGNKQESIQHDDYSQRSIENSDGTVEAQVETLINNNPNNNTFHDNFEKEDIAVHLSYSEDSREEEPCISFKTERVLRRENVIIENEALSERHGMDQPTNVNMLEKTPQALSVSDEIEPSGNESENSINEEVCDDENTEAGNSIDDDSASHMYETNRHLQSEMEMLQEESKVLMKMITIVREKRDYSSDDDDGNSEGKRSPLSHNSKYENVSSHEEGKKRGDHSSDDDGTSEGKRSPLSHNSKYVNVLLYKEAQEEGDHSSINEDVTSRGRKSSLSQNSKYENVLFHDEVQEKGDHSSIDEDVISRGRKSPLSQNSKHENSLFHIKEIRDKQEKEISQDVDTREDDCVSIVHPHIESDSFETKSLKNMVTFVRKEKEVINDNHVSQFEETKSKNNSNNKVIFKRRQREGITNQQQRLEPNFETSRLSFDGEENKENGSVEKGQLQSNLQRSMLIFEQRMQHNLRQEERILQRWEDLSGDFRTYRRRWAQTLYQHRLVTSPDDE